ncbi:Rne/Rng family ribonuclease [Citricoccus sp. NPDC079358]|uniref:Rne/Rng family ribonuclease n=1 Tax=Citricoccus sp. NPDC079358 TaxID=3154653 RepID=UPI00344D74F0
MAANEHHDNDAAATSEQDAQTTGDRTLDPPSAVPEDAGTTAAQEASSAEESPVGESEDPAGPSDTATAGGTAATEPADEKSAVDDPFAIPDDPLALIFKAPDLSTLPAVPRRSRDERSEREDRGPRQNRNRRQDEDASGGYDEVEAPAGDSRLSREDGYEQDDEGGQSGSRTSRRRRRSRGRSGSVSDSGRTSPEDGDDGDDQSQRGSGARGGEGRENREHQEHVDGSEAEGDGSGTRRRRKRRRGDVDMEMEGGAGDDPENTVTRVRAPRQAASTGPEAVTSLKGSTRLEAKRQRRRDSRSGGRQRRHVITEAEFLARRESVDRKMLVRQRDHRIQIAVMEDGVLAEHFVSNTTQDSMIGNVYVGKVQNVLPSMEAAFVDIGRGRNAVLYAGEVNWDAANLEGKSRKIENALKSGDSVLVQVTKDPVGHKGARLTSQISLPGRYLVYVPGGSMTGISRKLPDVERSRLKKILKDHLPENAGVIVRTAAEGTSEQELMHDINRLRAQWEGIEEKSTSTKTLAPELLYSEPDLTIKVVRDVFNEDFSGMIVQGEDVWDNIEAYVTYVAPDLLPRLEQWKPEEHDGEDLFASNRIDEQLQKALDRKVFLPSGGSLVIDRTEAMTVVDVNTGKFTGSGGNLEETVTKNNLEAAEEIVRQLRLRDIGGIIVIDFIDMVLESNRDLVLRRMVECLGRDRTKHQVAEVTSLGLVQMTRKRMGTGLVEIFSENCEHCNGRGIIVHDMPVEHRRAHTAHGEPRAHSASPSHGGSGGSARTGGSGGSGGPVQDDSNDGGRKSSRSERRRRSRERQAERERHEPQEPPVEHKLTAEEEAERKARAEAARAAFANMAAAAASAHEEKVEESTPEKSSEPAPERESGQDQPDPAPSTLSLAGEAVEVPQAKRRSRRSKATAAPQADLASLESALDQKTPRDQRASGGPAQAAQTGQAAQTAPAEPAARPQRRRRAASSEGAGDIRTVEVAAAGEQAGGGHRFSATAVPAGSGTGPEAQQQPAAASAAPMMLGVGVKAEDIARPE